MFNILRKEFRSFVGMRNIGPRVRKLQGNPGRSVEGNDDNSGECGKCGGRVEEGVIRYEGDELKPVVYHGAHTPENDLPDGFRFLASPYEYVPNPVYNRSVVIVDEEGLEDLYPGDLEEGVIVYLPHKWFVWEERHLRPHIFKIVEPPTGRGLQRYEEDGYLPTFRAKGRDGHEYRISEGRTDCITQGNGMIACDMFPGDGAGTPINALPQIHPDLEEVWRRDKG